MKKLLPLLACLFFFIHMQAQTTVTVTDSSFVAWLQANIPSAMNGNQMDTANSQLTSWKRINLRNSIVRNLDGIQYFDSLTALDCSSSWNTPTPNFLDSLPQLPGMLDTLICSNSKLQKITQLPPNLRYLNCSYNQLTSLPTLPNSLTQVECSNNMINYIPNLSDSLVDFNCNNNQLISLPAIAGKLVNFTCIHNLLQSLPALPATLVTLHCSNNHLTSLPALSVAIATINCDANQLQSLPALPASLTFLNCSSNTITALPALPNSLVDLNCSYNPLVSLPALPSSLINLTCSSDQLTALPALPNSLVFLDCSFNQLTALPALPNSLLHLICSANQITALPALPSALYKLICSFNPLPNLPVQPNSLVILDCSNDLLPSLPALSTSLTYLNCASNLLPVLPSLPASLTQLICSHNQLPVLPALPSALGMLDCSNNVLPALPVLPASLNFLNCNYNTITTLPALPAGLATLYCTNNLLAALPVLPPVIYDIDCRNNQLINLPFLPASLYALNCSYNTIHCFEPFKNIPGYLNVSNNPFTCLPNYIPSMDSVLLDIPLCKAGNPFGCPSSSGIVGYTYKDSNINCINDTTDQGLKNIPLKLYNSSYSLLGSTYSATNGVYQFLDSANVYTVAVDTVAKPYMATCQYPGLDSTVTVAVLDTNINFALGCKPGFDVGVQAISTCGIVFPGEIHSLRINAGDISKWYKLNCAAGISGALTIRVYGPVAYMGAAAGAIAPNVISNTLTYSIADFATINNSSDFRINLRVNTSAQAGDTIRIVASITPQAGDNYKVNNNYTFCYNVVNSHDPNIKEVYPVNVMPDFKGWLTYTIHFQNTGNAPAFNIRLADTLDQELDLSTFEVIDYSHTNTVSLNGRVLSVYYENIQLPDSSSNPEGSIGFIQYRLKAKSSWGLRYKIKNTAYIYFDYNAPIITNTTYNSIIDIVTGIDEIKENGDVIYPNPNNGIFSVKLNSKEKQTLEVIDIAGNSVLIQLIENGQATIDASYLAAGVYNVMVKSQAGIANKKLVIVK